MEDRRPTLVLALGGNAILRPGQRGSFEEQYANVRTTAEQLVELLARGYRLVVTHGNGPQVGNLLLGVRGHDQTPDDDAYSSTCTTVVTSGSSDRSMRCLEP